MKRIFLSHAHSERKLASRLAERLEAAGYDVFKAGDVEELPAGANFSLEVGRKLEKAQMMVVLLSPDAIKSPLIMSEIEYGLTTKRLKGKLVPVLVRNTRDFPWILKRTNFIDLTRDPMRGTGRVVTRLKKIDAAA